MVNVPLEWVLTWLQYGINRPLRMIGQLEVDIRVEVPMHKVTLLVFVGIAFDTSMTLESELEDRRRASLDKIDIYFYKAI